MKATKCFTMIAALALIALGAAQLVSAMPVDITILAPVPRLSLSSPTITISGGEWVVQFAVTNVGRGVARPFTVAVVDNAAGGTQVTSSTGSGLAAGTSQHFSIRRQKTAAQCKLTIRIDVNTTEATALASFDACVTAHFDWRMDERMVSKYLGDGNYTIDLNPSRPFIHGEGGWKVSLNGCASSAGDLRNISYSWSIAGKEKSSPTCSMTYTFLAQGTYPVTFIINAWDARSDAVTTERVTQNVVVKDLLIVSIGDSVASGEGNPDVSAHWGTAHWEDDRCHRSALSGPAQAALEIYRKDPHTSVTFLSLACSGAGIVKGLLEPYDGIERQGNILGAPLAPQLDALTKLVCDAHGDCNTQDTRVIDALVISIGANDVHFGDIAFECVTSASWDVPCSSPSGIRNRLEEELAALPLKFDTLATRIRDKGLKIKSVYITEYFNPVHDGDWTVCDEDALGFTRDEAQWAENRLLIPLNKAIRVAADNHEWIYVGGIADKFLQHGYCAADNWVVTYDWSLYNQGNTEGTMHPNATGHRVYKKRLVEEITRVPSWHAYPPVGVFAPLPFGVFAPLP